MLRKLPVVLHPSPRAAKAVWCVPSLVPLLVIWRPLLPIALAHCLGGGMHICAITDSFGMLGHHLPVQPEQDVVCCACVQHCPRKT